MIILVTQSPAIKKQIADMTMPINNNVHNISNTPITTIITTTTTTITIKLNTTNSNNIADLPNQNSDTR